MPQGLLNRAAPNTEEENPQTSGQSGARPGNVTRPHPHPPSSVLCGSDTATLVSSLPKS